MAVHQEKLPDGSYVVRYKDGRKEIFTKEDGVVRGSGPVKHLEELFNPFMRIVMNNRPKLNDRYSDRIKLMHEIGYFVVPNILKS